MARVLVKMRSTSANPHRVLHAGKVYKLDEAEAEVLIADGTGADGKPAAVLVTSGKVNAIEKPDPGDTTGTSEEDE